MFSVKQLVESGCLTSVPPKYVFKNTESDDCMVTELEAIPTIDFSLLTSGNPDERSEVINELRNACQEWGFFMVINHGVPETLRKEMIRATKDFFDLAGEEKQQYTGKKLFDPIRCGTSFNPKVDKVLLWRDYLKAHVHPHFSAPNKPSGFGKVLKEYCKRTREMASELLKGISESLGLEESYINEKMAVESADSHQLLVANMYPPCPQPELSMVNMIYVSNMKKILTNGKYKSVVHRAVVNDKATRISIGTAHGPPLDTIVSPAAELVTEFVGQFSPAYRGIKYKEYLELQQSKSLNGKSCLDHLRL
ncbi:hypothetical protein QUC31_000496 [Theobroma cacao]